MCFMNRIYSPSNNLLQAIRNLLPLEICPWDDYYPRMAQTDYLDGRYLLKSSKTCFYRTAPFKGSYAILGGMISFLRILQDYEFDDVVEFAMLDMGYNKDFVSFMKQRKKLQVKIYAIEEGSLIFPNEPYIIIEGCLGDIRFAEGMLLKQVNFASLAFTKWSRVAQAAAPGVSMEFSRRRSQDDIRTSIYAHLAGITYTSNGEVRRGLNAVVKGTMGHEFPQSYGDEYTAYDRWLEYNPDKPVLIADTINTLKSGLPNAIKAFSKHWERIKNAGGIPGFRLDSEDLAYLTIESRRGFNEANLFDVMIFETNELDEYTITNIREQIYTNAPKAGLDVTDTLTKIVWACGTKPGVCSDQASFGGVAKLSSIEQGTALYEVIKLAKDNPIKTSIPGNNRSSFVFGDNNELLGVVIHPRAIPPKMMIDQDNRSKMMSLENTRVVQRQQLVFDNITSIGIQSTVNIDTTHIKAHHQEQLGLLHWTQKRFDSPHLVKVGLSTELFDVRQRMIEKQLLINI